MALKLRLPDTDHKRVPRSVMLTLREQGLTLRQSRPFVSLLIGQFVLRIGLYLALPLFPIYWVRVAHLSDVSISAITGTQTIVTTVAYFLWARASQQRGDRVVLLITTLGIGLYPLLTALTTACRSTGPLGGAGRALRSRARAGHFRYSDGVLPGGGSGRVHGPQSDDRLVSLRSSDH